MVVIWCCIVYYLNSSMSRHFWVENSLSLHSLKEKKSFIPCWCWKNSSLYIIIVIALHGMIKAFLTWLWLDYPYFPFSNVLFYAGLCFHSCHFVIFQEIWREERKEELGQEGWGWGEVVQWLEHWLHDWGSRWKWNHVAVWCLVVSIFLYVHLNTDFVLIFILSFIFRA